VFSLTGITLVGIGATAATTRGSFVAMASRPSFVVCCDDAYAPLLDAVLILVRVKRNAESQSSMQDVSWPVGLPSNNSLDRTIEPSNHLGHSAFLASWYKNYVESLCRPPKMRSVPGKHSSLLTCAIGSA
jgi:hypothetical protein